MDISETGLCGANYQGIACSSCSAKNAKFGCRKFIKPIFIHFLAGQRCFDCRIDVIYYLRFIIYLGIQIGVITFATKYVIILVKICMLFRKEHI